MSEFENKMPKIRTRELLRAYKQIKPVSTIGANNYREIIGWNDFNGKHFFEKEPDQLRDIIYTTDPILSEMPRHLIELDVIPTYHKIKAYMKHVFRPTIAEVLAQIPKEYNGGKVAAFDLSSDYELTSDEKCHTSTAMIFKKRYALAD